MPLGRRATLSDAVYAAMTARGMHRAPAHTGQRPLRRWQPCAAMWTASTDAFQIQHEWFSSPLSTHANTPLYAT